ncbi:MAG: hypothetical protein ACRD82_13145 [Blastocatellia bacterium]
MTLTIDLPDRLTEQLNARAISEKEVNSVLIAALEIWLTEPAESKTAGRFGESAVPFVKRLVGQNRELFEALA